MMSGNYPEQYYKRLVEAGVDVYDARLELEGMAEASRDEAELESFVARRISGEPFAYIVGQRAFYKECYKVTPAVLIPRNDTEVLVETVAAACGCNDLPTGEIAKVPRMSVTGRVDILDLCTGSGCVGISLANELMSHGLEVTALLTDVSEEALKIAKYNAGRQGKDAKCFDVLRVDVTSDSLEKVFDIITANPPYIDRKAMEELPAQVGGKEPYIALFGGEDGLDFYRAIAGRFIRNLKAGGIIAVEHGFDQGGKVRKIWTEAGLRDVATIDDYGGNPRVTYGFKR